MSPSMRAIVVVSAWLIASRPFLSASEAEGTQLPENKNEFVNGFWFGTQSLFCINSKTGFLPHLSKRSIIHQDPSPTFAFPSRSNLRYVHRLLFYRGMTFEWGTGVQGHHLGYGASVRDCSVTWERSPAGESHCPVSKVTNFTLGYRNRFGPYNLLTNNCHHFANRISKLLMEEDCGGDPPPPSTEDDGVVTQGEKMLWTMVNYILSWTSPGTEDTGTQEPDIEASLVIT